MVIRRILTIVFTSICVCFGVEPSATKGESLYQVAVQEDIAYAQRENLVLMGDIYRPADSRGNPMESRRFPGVILIHGGGWVFGDKSSSFLELSHWYAERGYTVFNINYRLGISGKYPNSVLDVMCAVKFMRGNARALGVKRNNIALMGESAGGYLAAKAAVVGNNRAVANTMNTECDSYERVSPKVQVVIPEDGLYDFESLISETDHDQGILNLVEWYAGIESTDSAETWHDKYIRASVFTDMKRTNAQWLIFHGEEDPLIPVSHAELLLSVLSAKGIRAQLGIIPGAGHASFSGGFHESYEKALLMLEPWLRANFRSLVLR